MSVTPDPVITGLSALVAAAAFLVRNDGVDYACYLLRLVELELIDGERCVLKGRIRAVRF